MYTMYTENNIYYEYGNILNIPLYVQSKFSQQSLDTGIIILITSNKEVNWFPWDPTAIWTQERKEGKEEGVTKKSNGSEEYELGDYMCVCKCHNKTPDYVKLNIY